MTTTLKTRPHLPLEIAVEPPASLLNAELSFPEGIYNSEQQALELGSKIGVGGEGTVYNIQGQADLVAKIYHELPSAEKAEKLIALAHLGTERLFKMSAWPVDVLRDRPDGNVIGFVMKKIGQAEEVHTLHSPKSRLKKFPDASWAFLLHVATNIARAVATMHEHGFVVGDVNPKNILVTRQATIYLLDCDSFQFSAEGKTYRCEGGFPEYTPPELQGIPFSEVDRNQEHDCFGLAVVIFQLLFLGRHPYSGRFLGACEMPLEKAIREIRFAYGADAAERQMQPPPGTLSLNAIPASIVTLFHRAFLETDRPNPAEWIEPLEQLGKLLQRCALHNGHHYYAQLATCPWCDLETRAGIRLFNFQLAHRNPSHGQFYLDQILAEIDSLENIKSFPQDVSRSITEPSIAALQYAQTREIRFWLGVGLSVIAGILIGRALDMPAALLFLFGAGIFIRLIIKSNPDAPFTLRQLFQRISNTPPESLLKETQATKKQAEAQLKQLQKQLWGNKDSNKDYFEKIGKLKTQAGTYQDLALQRAQKLKQLEAKLQAKAVTQHLKQYTIQDASLSGCSQELKQRLREKGFITAADISEQRLRKKKTLNETEVQQLLQWRQELVQNFLRETRVQLPPAARVEVEKEIEELRCRLEEELMNTTEDLRAFKYQLEERRKRLLPIWTEAKLALMQVEKDLQEMAKQNRLLPAIIVMVVAFFFVSIFEPPRQDWFGRPIVTGTASKTDPTFNSYFNQGLQLLSKSDYQGAKEALMSAMPYVSLADWNDRYASFYHNLCYTKSKLNEAPQYIEYLESKLSVSPDRNDCRVQLIMLYSIEKQNEKAAAQYKVLKERQSIIAASVQAEMKTHGVDLELLTTRQPR